MEDVPDIKLMYPESKDGDFLAYVTYSVKPAIKIEESAWFAGNGEISGEWIRHKSACLIITKNDGEYSIVSDGTGW